MLDQGAPAPLARHLGSHDVKTAFEMGWSSLGNGDLLAQAEVQGFDLLITTDRNLKYQQNLRGRRLAILVLSTTSWPRIKVAIPAVAEAIDRLEAGGYAEVLIP